ncbi:transcription termination factor Rho, partial [Jatrophihabitans endophyticus]|uniref:transcription termination factor Rho n=1 Tax=Jatrophihabitans endophyticus TaxID=1206085 RepID=UPI0019DF3D45|nr:transcription termination factor Rho [Jatrophihabitans endophyticus]
STPTLDSASAPAKANGIARRASAPSDDTARPTESSAPAAEQSRAEQSGGEQSGGEQSGGEQSRGEKPTGESPSTDRRPDTRADRTNADRTNADRQANGRASQSNGNQNHQNAHGETKANEARTTENRAAQNGHQNETGHDDDDSETGSRRRGRRYRDRRGRNRNGGADGRDARDTRGGDSEPTVNDDDVVVPVAGVVDTIEEKNNWFVRVGGYFPTPDDVFISNTIVRRYGLRRGDAVTGAVRQPREGERREKYNPLVRLDSVNGREPDAARSRPEFTKLTPLYPNERLRLETEPHVLTTRVIDLVMPIGKGQRALIVSPPKAGKTMVLQSIANAISVNNPEAHLMVVLVDERPEEVTDMQRSVKGEVIASTFDRRPQDHITVAELSIERAKRLVEMGHDVVVLLDSITRLGRAYNLGAPASGRILSGGVDSQALYQPKRFLGAARNIENGGSLTIIATALVETGSAGDTVFFEEYKGTGNAELKLDRKIADKRIFPAIDVDQSSTRKEEILLSPDELAVTIKLRRVLHALDAQQAIELLLDRLRKSRTNVEFLMNIAKTTPGNE